MEYSTFRDEISRHHFSSSDCLDHYYFQIYNLDNISALKKVLKTVLTLGYGQAEIECGFSVNKEVTVENLLEGNLVARRLLCQFVNGKFQALWLARRCWRLVAEHGRSIVRQLN